MHIYNWNILYFLGVKVSVQAEVEAPQWYIFARCPSTDQQLMYSDTRMEDIQELSTPIISDSIIIQDIAKIFKG